MLKRNDGGDNALCDASNTFIGESDWGMNLVVGGLQSAVRRQCL